MNTLMQVANDGMVDYMKIDFFCQQQEDKEVLLAFLNDMNFDSFLETDKGLEGYIDTQFLEKLDLAVLHSIFDKRVTWSAPQQQENKNWNINWESNYDSIKVGDVYVRASFHKPNPDCTHEIVVTPKMSFGTGHHATTQSMIAMMTQHLQKEHLTAVLDYGTGTGILAIYAKILGAQSIDACDIDQWSIENTAENFDMNNMPQIDIRKGDITLYDQTFSCILANINKNVLLNSMVNIRSKIQKSGHLLLSGFYVEDEKDISLRATDKGFELADRLEKDRWVCHYYRLI